MCCSKYQVAKRAFILVLSKITLHIYKHTLGNSLQLLELLNNKIQLNKFKDLIGFNQRFMSRAASHLAYRKEL